jgi:glycosyltransferase involved in cell wall biosynthesis
MTYWLNLLPSLAEVGGPHSYLVLVGAGQDRIPIDLPGNFQVERVQFGSPVRIWRLAWEQTRLPLLLRKRGIDVLLAPADIAPFFCPCPIVMAIRNPNPHWGPRASTLKGRLRDATLRQLTRVSAARAHSVFFVSEDSRQRISPSLGLSRAKSSVVYHGIGRQFLTRGVSEQASPSRDFGGPYVLSVSVVRIHKDFETLIRAFAAFAGRDIGRRDYKLIIAGTVIDQPYYERLRGLVSELGLDDSVRFLGEVRYADLPPLYRDADLFVLPSLAETFGHPLVEAMASGLPVIATDLDVMREICADAAEYFRPADWTDLLAKMETIVSDDALRRTRIAAGIERAAEFSWDRCALETLKLLESAARAS